MIYRCSLRSNIYELANGKSSRNKFIRVSIKYISKERTYYVSDIVQKWTCATSESIKFIQHRLSYFYKTVYKTSLLG